MLELLRFYEFIDPDDVVQEDLRLLGVHGPKVLAEDLLLEVEPNLLELIEVLDVGEVPESEKLEHEVPVGELPIFLLILLLFLCVYLSCDHVANSFNLQNIISKTATNASSPQKFGFLSCSEGERATIRKTAFNQIVISV